MQLPADVRASALAHVALFCENRVPEGVRDEIRLEHGVRGSAITILECRPPWREGLGSEWTRSKIAQLRYDAGSSTWSLCWADHNGRWLPYDRVAPAADHGGRPLVRAGRRRRLQLEHQRDLVGLLDGDEIDVQMSVYVHERRPPSGR